MYIRNYRDFMKTYFEILPKDLRLCLYNYLTENQRKRLLSKTGQEYLLNLPNLCSKIFWGNIWDWISNLLLILIIIIFMQIFEFNKFVAIMIFILPYFYKIYHKYHPDQDVFDEDPIMGYKRRL